MVESIVPVSILGSYVGPPSTALFHWVTVSKVPLLITTLPKLKGVLKRVLFIISHKSGPELSK